jgi:thiol-disulfide isomerase/thioredoxin
VKTRWTIAVIGSLALALLTLGVSIPWFRSRAARAGNAACDAGAKPANLNFTMKDLEDKDVTLASYKGKVIVLDFWATWCGPCKLEIPGFVDLQTRYGAKGLQFVGISVDDKLPLLKPYAAEYKMNYPVLQGLGHEEVQNAYGPIWGIPVTVVIDRDGKICRKHEGMTGKDVFEGEIKSLL